MLDFLYDLGGPLSISVGQEYDSAKLYNFLKEVEIPTYDNKMYIFYYDVL